MRTARTSGSSWRASRLTRLTTAGAGAGGQRAELARGAAGEPRGRRVLRRPPPGGPMTPRLRVAGLRASLTLAGCGVTQRGGDTSLGRPIDATRAVAPASPAPIGDRRSNAWAARDGPRGGAWGEWSASRARSPPPRSPRPPATRSSMSTGVLLRCRRERESCQPCCRCRGSPRSRTTAGSSGASACYGVCDAVCDGRCNDGCLSACVLPWWSACESVTGRGSA